MGTDQIDPAVDQEEPQSDPGTDEEKPSMSEKLKTKIDQLELKAKIDQLELDRRLDELTTKAKEALGDAKASAGNLAHDNRERVDGWVDKATAAVDQRTDGKYHDKLDKFGHAVGSLVDKVADKRPQASPDVDDATTPYGQSSVQDAADPWTPSADDDTPAR